MLFLIIAVTGLTADVETAQQTFVRRIDPEMRRILQIQIHIFTVDRGDTGYIFRFFHTPFDLEGVNPCLDQLRQILQRVHILQAEQILFLPL